MIYNCNILHCSDLSMTCNTLYILAQWGYTILAHIAIQYSRWIIYLRSNDGWWCPKLIWDLRNARATGEGIIQCPKRLRGVCATLSTSILLELTFPIPCQFHWVYITPPPPLLILHTQPRIEVLIHSNPKTEYNNSSCLINIWNNIHHYCN